MPTKKKKASLWGGYADNLSRGFLEGALPVGISGFLDNAEAAAYSLPNWAGGSREPGEDFNQAYARQLAEVRDSQKQWDRENPGTALAARIAGTAAPILLTPGAAPKAIEAIQRTYKDPGLLAKMMKGASDAVVPGMLSAAGYGNAPLLSKDTVDNAISGGLLGATIGGVVPAISAGVKASAQGLAESALEARAKDRARKAIAPGRAALDYTTGIRPEAIRAQANDVIERGVAEQDRRLNAPGLLVDTGPAQDLVSAEANKHRGSLSSTYAREASEMKDALTRPKPGFYGASIDPNPPVRAPNTLEDAMFESYRDRPQLPTRTARYQFGPDALRMKREFGQEYANWNPSWQPSAWGDQLARRLYGELDQSLDRAAPGTKEINDVMSALATVRNRAAQRVDEAGIVQRAADRYKRPTGGAVAGLTGYVTKGLPGMAAAVAAQETLAAPSSRMAVARLLDIPHQLPEWKKELIRRRLVGAANTGLLFEDE